MVLGVETKVSVFWWRMDEKGDAITEKRRGDGGCLNRKEEKRGSGERAEARKRAGERRDGRRWRETSGDQEQS